MTSCPCPTIVIRPATSNSRHVTKHDDTESAANGLLLPPMVELSEALVRTHSCKAIDYTVKPPQKSVLLPCTPKSSAALRSRSPSARSSTITDAFNNFRARLNDKNKTKNGVKRDRLSWDCEVSWQQYERSAPARGLTGRHTSRSSLRPRSRLYQPFRTLRRQDTRKLMLSVEEATPSSAPPILAGASPRKCVAFEQVESHHVSEESTPKYIKKTQPFESFEAFKECPDAGKPVMPEDLGAPYLTREKAARIWDWLIAGDVLSPFNYFMQICS